VAALVHQHVVAIAQPSNIGEVRAAAVDPMRPVVAFANRLFTAGETALIVLVRGDRTTKTGRDHPRLAPDVDVERRRPVLDDDDRCVACEALRRFS
jgi:hypothetical protein